MNEIMDPWLPASTNRQDAGGPFLEEIDFMLHLSNQVCMITGASGNLGGAVARAFYEGGARLTLVDRHEDLVREKFPDLVDSPNCFMIGELEIAGIQSFGGMRPSVG